MTANPVLAEHAVALAKRGIAVFPLRAKEKIPATSHGFKDATTDIQTVKGWWEGWPEQNIGIATGERSGIFVVDVDGESGEATIRGWEAKYESLPKTVEVITGKGRHLYFRWVAGLKCTARRIGPGVDTRGDGGYVVAAPSMHPNGRRYEYSVDGASEFAEPPEWLVDLLSKPLANGVHANGHGSAHKDHILKQLGSYIVRQVHIAVPQGDRSDHSYHVMCRLFEKGLSDWDVQIVADGAPFAEKFWARGDLLEEITRARGRWQSHGGKSKTAIVKHWRESAFTAAELQKREFPPVSWIVPALIPEGLTLIAGRPKIGKSWLALDLAVGVASGEFVLGATRPEHGAVLYCAMEDNPRRLQKRMAKLSTAWPERLTLATSWRRLDQGGVEDIAEWAEGVDRPKLVILDTLAACRPVKANGTGAYTDDYEALAAVHKLANERGLGVLALHHVRKMEAEDPIDQVSGTLGLSGAADTVMVFKRSGTGTTLYARGRDIEEFEKAVEFRPEACRWRILGDAAEVRKSDTRKSILEALEASAEPMTPTDIAIACEMDANLAKVTLFRMHKNGEVNKAEKGKYQLRHAQV